MYRVYLFKYNFFIYLCFNGFFRFSMYVKKIDSKIHLSKIISLVEAEIYQKNPDKHWQVKKSFSGLAAPPPSLTPPPPLHILVHTPHPTAPHLFIASLLPDFKSDVTSLCFMHCFWRTGKISILRNYYVCFNYILVSLHEKNRSVLNIISKISWYIMNQWLET